MHEDRALPPRTFPGIALTRTLARLLGLQDVGDPTHASVQVAEDVGVGGIVDWDGESEDSWWRRGKFLAQQGQDCGLREAWN